jgi:signal transduction histidine kinase
MRRTFSLVLLRILLLAGVYTVGGILGLRMDPVSGFATLVWPPTGVSLAVLSLLGVELWPGVALGAFLTNLVTGATVPVALGICAGNTLEALAGTYLLRGCAGLRGPMRRTSEVLWLVGPVALGTTVLSATIGVASLLAGRAIDSHLVGATWRAWWVGDALSDLTVGSLLLTWASAPRWKPRGIRVVEALGLAASSILVGASVSFAKPGPPGGGPFLEPYLAFSIFPLLMWAALRFGLRGTTATMFLVWAVATVVTARGRGLFVRETLSKSLLYLQVFMGFATIVALAFGAVVSELAESVRSRERVLAVVSHDLKNPLHTIRMAACRLKRTEIAESDRLVGPIERAVDRMDRLIGDLLDLAAMDAGAMSLSMGPQDARALMDEAIEMMRPLASERGQTLRADVEWQDVTVMCDRERILQVFSNLIGNAIKFTPEGGTIVAAIECADPATARFRVSDTGVGIAPADMPQLFERFRRGTCAPRQEGTGLGLSIAKAIVGAHGGKIWAESSAGKGSTFFFTLRAQGSTCRAPITPPRRFSRAR